MAPSLHTYNRQVKIMVGAIIFFGGGVIHPLSPNNDQQSAGILHISSIATNNDQCLEKKLIRETISFWTEDLSGHTE